MEKSYICQDEEATWCGNHILIDMWCNDVWLDSYQTRTIMELAAKAANATILHSHFHDFANGGVSGVVVLAESHISYHSWPKKNLLQ